MSSNVKLHCVAAKKLNLVQLLLQRDNILPSQTAKSLQVVQNAVVCLVSDQSNLH